MKLLVRGQTYDVGGFPDQHPGGKQVLERASELSMQGYDVEPMIRMYHSANLSETIMHRFLSGKFQRETTQAIEPICANGTAPSDYDYTDYLDFKRNVETKYPRGSTPFGYIAIVAIQFGLFVATLAGAICYESHILASVGAVCMAGLLFNVLHDASHYAIFSRPASNELVSNIANAWTLWDGRMWHAHHVHLHHSYTGDRVYDPDTGVVGDDMRTGLWFLYILAIAVFPSQVAFQSIAYALPRSLSGLPVVQRSNKWLPVSLIRVLITYYLGWRGLTYTVMEGFLYRLNTVGNHYQVDTVYNHYDGANWMERQVRNTGDFACRNRLWSVWFGGINHQIVHHLFPGYNNQSLAEIKKELQIWMRERDIKWQLVEERSVWCMLTEYLFKGRSPLDVR